jgi:FG-GAP-like repeat
MPITLRQTGVLLSVLATGLAVISPASLTHPTTPATAQASELPLAPAMVLNTAGGGTWYSKNIVASHYSSPAVAAVGKNGALEIVDGFPDGTVQGWSLAGAHLWTFKTGHGAVQASPTIVDLNHDGRLDVITADTRGDVWGFTPSLNNKVIFKQHTGDGVHEPGDFATPAVADINKDGQLDVIETSWDHHIHVWSGKAPFKELPGFPVFLQDTSWSSPAVADIDKDGWPEIVFGYDCAGVAGQNCHPHPGGYVGVLRHDGTWEKGWPKFISQVVWSSPAIVDLMNNGKKDIVVGTGSMPGSSYKKMLAFTSSGHSLVGFPSAKQSQEVTSSPAIGDVDGDGKKDIVYTTNDGILRVMNRAGKITASTCLAGSWHTCPISYRANASLADVNNDGKMDIVVGNELSLAVYDKVGSKLVKIMSLGTFGFQPGAFTATPTVVQVAGQTWIVAATTQGAKNVGKVFVWKLNNTLGKAPWPTFKQSYKRISNG